MYYKYFRKITSLKRILILLFITSTATYTFAQPNQSSSQRELKENYEKKELTQFIKANQEVTSVQQDSEQKIISTIEEEGLDVNTFNKILTAKQQQKEPKNASEEELKQFNAVINDVIKIQQNTKKKMNQAIKNNGLEVNKYDQIMYAYQNSKKVKQEVDQLIQKNQK